MKEVQLVIGQHALAIDEWARLAGTPASIIVARLGLGMDPRSAVFGQVHEDEEYHQEHVFYRRGLLDRIENRRSLSSVLCAAEQFELLDAYERGQQNGQLLLAKS